MLQKSELIATGPCNALKETVTNAVHVYTNDVNVAMVTDTHLDATTAAYYETFLLNHDTKGLLVTSMPFSLSDIVIPMLLHLVPWRYAHGVPRWT